MKYLPRVLRYVLPYKPLAAISAALTALTALVSLLQPWPLKILVDTVLGDQPLPPELAGLLGPGLTSIPLLLVAAVVGGLLVTLVVNGLHVLGSYVNTKLEQRMVLDFRADLFEHAQRLSLAYHDQKRSGLLMYAINFEASAAGGL